MSYRSLSSFALKQALTQSSSTEQTDSRQKLTKIVFAAHDVLASATTVFPFTLFPDTVSIDREKITITHRSFFMVSEIISFRIEDILNIASNTGPFFGSLQISTKFFDPEKPYIIKYLWREDALRIKNIVQGYIIAANKKIDCSTMPKNELVAMLSELGKDAPEQ